jgi:type II secretory pathway pseudopilin PulG
MQGLLSLRGALGRRLKDERGWALIDAIASAVVVVLAFTGTTMAFNGSTASVQRDQKKTQALIVAQNQINMMRGLGQSDIDNLLALNDKTVQITFRGTPYTVTYDAYYVTGLGSDQQDACAVSFASGGGTARYIYMRADVTYAGQSTSAVGSSDPYLSHPASLDSYYSPEGGGVQADTGTLRVYVLDRRAIVAGGVSSVKLYIAGDSTAILPQTSNTTTGCYLFTGLVRNTYQVRVTVDQKQDIYMTNGSHGYVTLNVVMPDRGALSRDIRIDKPVTVQPQFFTATNGSPNYEVRTANGAVNPFFGKWIASTEAIKAAPTADFSYIPTGLSFMPHATTPTYATLPDAMFPNQAGYATYAGPCDANDPNAGAADGVNNTIQAPLDLMASNWGPDQLYKPQLWLTQLRTSIHLNGVTTVPSPTQASRTYYYGQQFDTTSAGVLPATVKVRLTADAEGTTTTARCKPSTTLFNTWQTLGTLGGNDATLADNLEALPTGMYDVCVYLPWKSARVSTSSTNVLGTPTWTYGNQYYLANDVPILYRQPVTKTFDATWAANTATPTYGAGAQSANCAT